MSHVMHVQWGMANTNTTKTPRHITRLAQAATNLRAAAACIEQPAAWCQGAAARITPDGPGVTPLHPRATCWCGYGALKVVTNTKALQDAPGLHEFENYLGKHHGSYKVGEFNDAPGRTAAEVAQAMRACADELGGGAP